MCPNKSRIICIKYEYMQVITLLDTNNESLVSRISCFQFLHIISQKTNNSSNLVYQYQSKWLVEVVIGDLMQVKLLTILYYTYFSNGQILQVPMGNFNRIGGVMVSMLASVRQIMGLSPDRVKPKTINWYLLLLR